MTEIWFIRHGETDWNRERRLQGWQDIPLNAAGVEQAARLAERLRADAARTPFAALYSSDLLRARATAQPLSEALGLALRTEPGIRERRFGVLEGLPFERLDELAPQAAASWRSRDPLRPLEGGETLGSFHERIVAAVDGMARRHRGERILAVTHGGALDLIWRQANGTALDAPRSTVLHNVGINRVRVAESGWEILDWGDVAHMQTARDDIV